MSPGSPDQAKRKKKDSSDYTGGGRDRPPKASPVRTVLALVVLCVLMVAAVWEWLDLTGWLPVNPQHQANRQEKTVLASLDRMLR